MNETGKDIVQQLFGKTSIAEVSPKAIEQIVSRYPYFGPAQFLLAKKLKDSNGYGSEMQSQKAMLYFTNPYWLNFLLTEPLITEEAITETYTEAPAEVIETEQEPIIDAVTEEPAASAIEIEEQQAQEIAEDAVIDNLDRTDTETPALNYTNNAAITEEIIDEEEEYLPTDEETESDPQRLRLSGIIEQHLANFKKPVEAGEELPIKANPYHTVDYFASQGIKADGSDKLTHRVKKFTDWLKQMKTPNAPQPTDLGTDAETEQMIETIAQTSNETRDIVTEAMAEVLVKQGKTEKALQLYKKLSFLNPAKSTYFAAKIDELNSK